MRPNLRVITGSAEYGAPGIQDVFELEELFFPSGLLTSVEARSGENNSA
jgi:hypothetical protein